MRRRGLALLLGLGLAAGLAEALLRVPLDEDTLAARPPSFWEATRELHRALHMRSRHPALIYEPRRSASVEMHYGPARFSPQGLRGDRVSRRPTGPRIAMLGDSLVWGELVAEADSLPSQLQRRLGVEVLNFGVTGYDTHQEARWYEVAARAYRPDVVLLVFCLNDWMSMSGPLHLYATEAEAAAYAAERAALERAAPVRNETLQRVYLEELAQGSRALAVLRHLWRWHRHNSFGGYTDEYLLSAAMPGRAERVRLALERLGASVRADGAEPVMVIAPAVYWWHRYPWTGLHEQVAAQAVAAGFTVIDPLHDLRRSGDPQEVRFEGDNLHYNPLGNARLADAVARALIDGGLVPD